MSYRPSLNRSTGSDWPAVVVAMGIIVLLGAVLVTAAARWKASDFQDVVGSLAPVLGVVTGAFVTFFFTRQAAANASNAARSTDRWTDRWN